MSERTTINRVLAFTDIHWGKSNNLDQHNQDCEDYIDWLIDRFHKDGNFDAIMFLGDWFDHRSAVNVSTMNYSHKSAVKLSELGVPIYFIIGNHDLYHRHTREVYSVINFESYDNFIVVNEPRVFPELGKDGALLCPYIFNEEYPSLADYIDTPVWFGHFEFQGFVVTGYNLVMQHGPDHTLFKNGPKRIFSGHFHKRQQIDNVVYIGNCFPHNFADCDDDERGAMIYEFDNDSIQFLNWEDAPKFRKIKLSQIVAEEDLKIPHKTKVRCIYDVGISYTDTIDLRQYVIEQYELRDFKYEDTGDVKEALTNTETEIDTSSDKQTIDEMVVTMLLDIDVDSINSKKLAQEYMTL